MKSTRPPHARSLQGARDHHMRSVKLCRSESDRIRRCFASLESGEPTKSLLVRVVSGTHTIKMPPVERLNAEQVDSLKKWVTMGTPLPGASIPVAVRTGGVSDSDRQFWSFQPLAHPEPPALEMPLSRQPGFARLRLAHAFLPCSIGTVDPTMTLPFLA